MMATGEWRGEKVNGDDGELIDTRGLWLPIAAVKRLSVLLGGCAALIAFGGQVWAANDRLGKKADFSYVKTVDDSLGRALVHIAGRLDQVEGVDFRGMLRYVCEHASSVDRRKTGLRCP